jgi:NAD(P)H-dependent FMN reductase
MKDQMLKVAIILGSTRPGRNGEAVSQWIHEKRSDTDFELLDIKDFNLPLLDEPISPTSLTSRCMTQIFRRYDTLALSLSALSASFFYHLRPHFLHVC